MNYFRFNRLFRAVENDPYKSFLFKYFLEEKERGILRKSNEIGLILNIVVFSSRNFNIYTVFKLQVFLKLNL